MPSSFRSSVVIPHRISASISLSRKSWAYCSSPARATTPPRPCGDPRLRGAASSSWTSITLCSPGYQRQQLKYAQRRGWPQVVNDRLQFMGITLARRRVLGDAVCFDQSTASYWRQTTRPSAKLLHENMLWRKQSSNACWLLQSCREMEMRSLEPSPLRWCNSCYRSIRSSILERTILDIQYPTASGIYRRNNRSITNRDYALSCSELAGEPETDVATGCPPLKNDYGFEASIIRVATIDLELVRLNRNFVLPCGSHLTSLDKFDVGIGVVNPDRSCTSMFTCLFDTQSGLVVCRVCGRHLQNSRCRGEGTLI